MLSNQSSSNKFTIYKDPACANGNKVLAGFKGTSFLDTGYIFAPYIPIQVAPTIVIMSPEQIKEETRVPIKVIKAALKQAGYKNKKDFEVIVSKYSATITVIGRPGRRFTEWGSCTVSTMRKGKLSITWTYDPCNGMGGKDSKNVDVSLADPGCFQQIGDTIIAAIKENQTKPSTPNKGILTRYGKAKPNPSYYGTVKVTI